MKNHVKVRFHDPFDSKICQFSNIKFVKPENAPRNLALLWSAGCNNILGKLSHGKIVSVRLHQCGCGRWWFKITKPVSLPASMRGLWTADFIKE